MAGDAKESEGPLAFLGDIYETVRKGGKDIIAVIEDAGGNLFGGGGEGVSLFGLFKPAAERTLVGSNDAGEREPDSMSIEPPTPAVEAQASAQKPDFGAMGIARIDSINLVAENVSPELLATAFTPPTTPTVNQPQRANNNQGPAGPTFNS